MALALCLMFGSAASLPDGVFETSTSISLSASANGGPAHFVSGDYEYQLLEDGTASITGYKGTATKLTIPSKLDDKIVTEIGGFGGMDYDCTKLKSITIPSSVTSIGDAAFIECTNLENITIPSSVTSIGGGAFTGTKWLKNQQEKDPQVVVNGILIDANKCKGKVTISSSVKTIGNGAFMDNENITSVTIPKSVTSIGSGAFFNCTNLENITIPNSVTSIGGSAFSETKWLEKQREKAPLVIVNGIVIDGKNCKGKVTIPSDVKTIGDQAFGYNENITSITIPDSVESIGEWAFNGCSGIKSITIPDSVTSIGSWAFSNISITSVTIPGSVSSIGEDAFQGCSKLKKVTIKDGVTRIDGAAFYECENLESITIPNSVTSIGRVAFELCRNLKSITIPGSVINVGEFAFNACSNLSSITIEEGVTSIGNSAFCNCNATSVTIPKSVTSIGEGAFGYIWNENPKIEDFKIYCYKDSAGEKYAKDNEFDYEIIKEDYEYKLLDDGTIEIIKYNGLDKDVFIPETIDGKKVTSIGENAFQSCTAVSITIPQGVTNIGKMAFDTCTSLTSVTIPNSVTSIGESAFGHCGKLTSITIPGSVASIGKCAFVFCSSLKSVTLSNGLKELGDSAFSKCTSLESITIPASVEKFDTQVFTECTKLASVTIENGVKTIGNGAFMDCTALKEVTIPNSVTNIEFLAFAYCTSLEIITIPSSVTSIGKEALGRSISDKKCKILCYKGSAAEKYAIDNKHEYELLGLEHVEAKAATCTEDGNIEYWKYDGKFYSDEKATNEITEADTIVKAVHKFEDKWTVTKEATCTQAGSEERVCTVCGGKEEGGTETREIKAKGHKFDKEWTVVRTASAGKPSLRVRYCVNCKGEEEGGMQEKEGSTTLEKERVYGDNRFKTSLAIADQLKNANNGKDFENIIVASGADFADALSASYLAKVKNAPILLVANKATAVINETVDYISKNSVKGANVYIVGGTSVVPSSMISDLKKLGFKAKRLAGNNRYDTNIEVLKEAGVTNEKILIASGMDYADALSASAVGLPILLVAGKGKSLTPNQKAYLNSLKDVTVDKGAAPLSYAYIIGGTGAVSADIFKQAKGYFAGVSRVYGSNRYETSVKVAEKFFKNKAPATVAVAYGMNYPDGLCGGPLALAYNCPLILTINQKPDAAVAYAKSIKAKSVVAFGGKQLISLETMNKILGK